MRIVDLSKKLTPGKEVRRLAIRRFTYGAGEIMHEVDLESHLGTHIEAPSHYIDAVYDKKGKDISEFSVDKFMGPGVFIPLSSCKPREALPPQIFKEREVAKGDVVLVGNSPYTGPERPQIASESIEWLVAKRIKILGIDDSVRLGPRPPTGFPKSLKDMVDHDLCLSNEILLIEQLAHLDELRKSRFFFIGLPISIVGMDSFPIRAVAIEDWPKDQWPEL